MDTLDVGNLLDRVEPSMRRRYLEVIARLRARNDLAEIARLVDQRRWEEAVQGLEEAAEELSEEFRLAFLVAAKAVADLIRASSSRGFAFDVTHWRVQALFRALERDVVGMFRDDVRGIISGAQLANARDTLPRDLYEALGLGGDQADYLRRYRASLGLSQREQARRTARGLDPRAAMSPAVQNRMVAEILRRLRAAQAGRVGLWLGQLAVQEAADIALRQALEFGALAADDVEREWVTRADNLVRDTHDPMFGQRRPVGTPFESGGGVPLMFPGDPSAPARETRGCRCGILIRIRG